MCQRRRWTAEQFRLFLVEHPLVRHLTRRLLWGFITMKTPLSPVFAWQKTALTAMRRMSYSRCQQETSVYRMCWKSPESAAAFRQIYVDYELLPLSNSSNVVVTTLLITNVMSMNCHAGTDVSARPDALSGLNAEAGNVWKKAAASMRCANLPLMVLSNLKQNLFINLWRNGV